MLRGTKARILLKADVSGSWQRVERQRIIEALETSHLWFTGCANSWWEEGFEAVLSRKPRAMPAVARIFDGEKEAKLIALAVEKPPRDAHAGLAVVGEQGGRTRHCRSCQRQPIGRALKKTLFSPSPPAWVISPKANSAFVAAMEDVLAVYTRPRDGDCPLVCLDETSKQLIAETRVPISMKAGCRPFRL